ncbi:MAG TPA: hypothetical protein VH054_25340 [Polyangiaceae bacterium]|jgi:hypothetical protein|nr:hypothetical protein [Polyangiaceae bacterium]
MKYVYFALIALAACKKDPPAPAKVDAAASSITREFDRDEDAFDVVLRDDPAVLAIGEAHAQRGSTVASSTKRFTDELLPMLAGRASDLLVELMFPPRGCNKEVQAAHSVQAPVITQQAETNKSEYAVMGEAARKVGIVPDLLRPTCDDLAAVNDAGDDAIPRSLEMIARLTTQQAKKMLANRGAKMIVTYGGALHNDASPPPERASWSYGPALSKEVAGKYVELDVYVPDFITDDENWKKQPWYAEWQAHKSSGKALLVTLAPKSYVLVLKRL